MRKEVMKKWVNALGSGKFRATVVIVDGVNISETIKELLKGESK